MVNKQNQQIYQPGQQQAVGNINPGSNMNIPNNSLTELDFYEEMGSREMELTLRPVSHVNIHIGVEHHFRNPDIHGIKPQDIERGLEDFIYLMQNYGWLDGDPRISFGGEVEERSGSKSPTDSYYYQGDDAVDVMTVEGENITPEDIRNASNDLIVELKNNNLL